jgi:hypothetical protein
LTPEGVLMTDEFRILAFAGHPVPENGLAISPPQGGEFTIWSDGGYAYTPPEGGGLLEEGASVSTFYSYVMEDIDGEVTVGTFALTPGQAALDPMPDFQAWSMDDILALEDTVGMGVDLFGPVAELSGFQTGEEVVSDPSLDLRGDFTSDVLEHVIKSSFES